MSRLRQFLKNAGTGGAIRTAFVIGFMLLLSAMMLIKRHDPMPLCALALSPVIPVLLRRTMVDNPETTSTWLKWASRLIIAATLLAGVMRESLTRAIPESALLTGLAALLGLYLSAYIVLYSDPEIRITSGEGSRPGS